MNPNKSLYTKTKQILHQNEFPQIDSSSIRINNYFYNRSQNNNNNPFDNKYILQKNNERLLNINKSIQEGKNKISNILSPLKSDIQKEEKDYQFNTTLSHLNNIKSIYNINSMNLRNDFNNIKNKKNKLVLVYNSLYHFKQKLLNKEKQIKEKEYNISKYENTLKTNENILKNNLEAFNNYINYQTQNLINKFKNIKNYHEQREEELKLREQKIKEYELIVKNIIYRREQLNQEKLRKCINIGKQLEKSLKMEMEEIKQKEKEEEIIKDIEVIEKEKEQIMKEKEFIQKEKEKIQIEKERNKKIKKRNKKLRKKENSFHRNKNGEYYNPIRQYLTPERVGMEISSNLFENFKSKNISERRNLTPIVYHSSKYKISNPYKKNNNKYNKRDDSVFSYINNSVHNYNTMQLKDESSIYPVKKINSYIHDNIYLLKNKINNQQINSINIGNLNNSNLAQNNLLFNTSRIANHTLDENRNVENYDNNIFTYRTKSIVDNNISDITDIIKFKNNDGSKSKYLETASGENDETYNDINKKILEIEKGLELAKSQDKKIQMIKDKLNKKLKNSS